MKTAYRENLKIYFHKANNTIPTDKFILNEKKHYPSKNKISWCHLDESLSDESHWRIGKETK